MLSLKQNDIRIKVHSRYIAISWALEHHCHVSQLNEGILCPVPDHDGLCE